MTDKKLRGEDANKASDKASNERVAEAEKQNDEVRAALKDAIAAQDKTGKSRDRSEKAADKS